MLIKLLNSEVLCLFYMFVIFLCIYVPSIKMLSIICFIPLVSFITTYFGGNMCLYYNRFFNVWTYVVSAYYTLMKHQKKKKVELQSSSYGAIHKQKRGVA